MSGLSIATAAPLAVRRPALLLAAIAAVTLLRLVAREALGLELHFDEAQYVVWSYEPAFGYFSKPPMIAWAIAAARAVCGESDFCVRLPAALALAAAAWLVFLTGRRLLDERAALWAALLFLLAPLVSFLSWFITTDSLLLLAWSAALYAFVRAVELEPARARPWWLAAGAAAGAGLLSKYTMGIFALSALGYLLTSPPRRAHLRSAGPWLGAATAALLFAPNVAWNAAHGFATFGHTATIANLDDARLGVGALVRAAQFLGAQIGVFGPVAMLALVAALWPRARGGAQPADARGSGRGEALRLLAWFTLPFLALISAQALAARAHANWAAPTYVGAALLAAAWMAARPPASGRRWLAAALAVNLALFALLAGYRPLLAALERPLARDPMAQLFGWSALGRAVEAQLAHGGAQLMVDERRLMSLAMRYGGPRARQALTWNPGGRIENHYQLTRDVARAGVRGPFLFISAQDRTEELRQAFDGVTPLGLLDTGGGRRIHAWRLDALRPQGLR